MIRLTRERLIGIIVAVILGGVAFVFGLRWLEFAITFHPVRIPANQTLPVPTGGEEVWFSSAEGTRLHGWLFRTKAPAESVWIIYFHGNGGNISNIDWVGQKLSRRGFEVLLFDYRGYGKSEGEVGSESGLYADGDAALAFIVNEKGARPEQVVLYGQSLGTTVAADMAVRHDVGAVILESGLSSASSVGRTALPWLPTWLHFLGTNRFESARKLAHVKAPVLITHGDPDPVVPTDEARILFAAANEPKQLLIFPGAGHNVFGSQGDEYLSQLERFIRESLKAPR